MEKSRQDSSLVSERVDSEFEVRCRTTELKLTCRFAVLPDVDSQLTKNSLPLDQLFRIPRDWLSPVSSQKWASSGGMDAGGLDLLRQSNEQHLLTSSAEHEGRLRQVRHSVYRLIDLRPARREFQLRFRCQRTWLRIHGGGIRCSCELSQEYWHPSLHHRRGKSEAIDPEFSYSRASIREDALTEFDAICDAYRRQVNAALQKYVQLDADCPPQLQKAMSYSLLAGGKRLRPVLVMLACEACGTDPVMALPAACALEMVHTYSLIHDDLPAMDDDDLRRGFPTNHKVFGEAIAILAGDALLTLAFEIIAREIQPASTAAACCLDLANAAGAVGMVAGQVADLEAETLGHATLEQLEAIHRRKTGRLLCSALTMGARVAQASVDSLTRLREYGLRIGLAFQIIDDLLDIRGNPEKVGKGVNKDAVLGKLTYPSLLGEAASETRAHVLINEACDWISPFGERGESLRELALFVLNRDH